MSFFRDISRLVRRLVQAALSDVHTHIPAQVVSYNAALNTCSIQLCINRIRTEDPVNLTTIEIPPVDDVPVKLFGSGKLVCAVAPQAGSYGILHVSERELETWLLKGGVVDPMSSRKFDIGDGWFDPGAYPILPDGDNGLIVPPIRTDRIEFRTRIGTSYVSLVDDGSIELTAMGLGLVTMATDGTITIENTAGSIELTAAGITEINSSADAAALASKVDLLWTTIDTLFRTGWVPAPPDGGAALKAAWLVSFPIPPTSVASTKLKVDL